MEAEEVTRLDESMQGGTVYGEETNILGLRIYSNPPSITSWAGVKEVTNRFGPTKFSDFRDSVLTDTYQSELRLPEDRHQKHSLHSATATVNVPRTPTSHEMRGEAKGT